MDHLRERRDRLVGSLLGEAGPEISAASLARGAVVVLGVENATINALDPENAPSLVASHGPLGEHLELLQQRVRDGPTIAALADHRTVVSLEPDSALARWPMFGPLATAQGVTALFSMPLRPRRDPGCALSLYTTDRAPFDEARIGDVLLVADIIAEALTNPSLAGLDDRLHRVGEEASAVHRATGVLVARHGITPAQALSTLRGMAADAKASLTSVATQVIEDGTVGPSQ